MTNDELRTIIALTGNKRLPDLEAEIFADKVLGEFYINTICSEFAFIDPRSTMRDKLAAKIYFYADETIARPWPEAEHLLKNTIWWGVYSRRFYGS